MEKERIEMSQRERDVLKVMTLVLKGERRQVEAARLLGLSERQVGRVRDRLEREGDKGVVHGLRGRPSNRRIDQGIKDRAMQLCRQRYGGFGPTLAAEKLAEEDGVVVAVRTLREWLLGAGLWSRQRRRDRHRSRRVRRECFGEMVQADASEHDWLEGRGPMLTLVGMIDDATGRMHARFYAAETSEAYMEVLGWWIRKHGRPVSWYCDRHGIFRAESRLLGADEPVAVATQFSRLLEELAIKLILANSPQAKGRIERLWGTCQDRLVKELRLAGARTMQEANAVLEKVFIPWFNRCCTVAPASGNDAHRPLGPGQDLAAILSIQERRTVANDYTIRFEKRVYQLLPPAWPGERGGQVVVEKRLDGSMKIRLKGRYLAYKVLTDGGVYLGAPPPNPRSLSKAPTPAEEQRQGPATVAAGPSAVRRTAGLSGRTAALPCLPNGESCGSSKTAWRPAPDHPWRRTRRRSKGATGHFYLPEQADISICA
jgi:hypothetical protein